MNVLRKGALNDACIQVAWQVLRSSKGVSTDLVETLASRYEQEALHHVESIQALGGDPNLLTRAVHFIADAHAIPPMGTDIIWFRNMLDFAVELAVPNAGLSNEAAAFLDDVRHGLTIKR
jgi:hypothetical protein